MWLLNFSLLLIYITVDTYKLELEHIGTIMDNVPLNSILNRDELIEKFSSTIHTIFSERDNPLASRGIYVYGSPGSGKTELVMRTLKKCGFDVVKYDSSDSRGKSTIDTMTKQHMPEVNILSMWNMKQKKIVIVMDELEAMNSGDKGGINALMKLLRPKKTKKQQSESQNYIPIVCISNRHVDKKIGDLMRVCSCFEVATPTDNQIDNIAKVLFKTPTLSATVRKKLVENVNGDLRKLSWMYEASRRGLHCDTHVYDKILASSSCNDDAKRIVRNVMTREYNLKEHTQMIGDADRTIVGLLWHENVVDSFKGLKPNKSIPLYLDLLRYLCVGDFIDRNTFQKQVWQFNEMSSIIKTMNGQHHYHREMIHCDDVKSHSHHNVSSPPEIRFTRVLTKYSSEFNNYSFIQTLCQKLSMDRKDVEHLFRTMSKQQGQESSTEIASSLSNYDIVKQEVERIMKLLNYDGTKKPSKTRRSTQVSYDEDEGDVNIHCDFGSADEE